LLPYYQDAQRLLISLTKAMAGHTTAVKIAVGVVAGLSAAILVANAAFKVYKAAQTAATVATYLWAAAQRVLNLAMRANPIGLVITAVALLAAGLVLAYKKSETFRNIVNASLNAVKNAALALGRGFQAVWQAAQSAWNWITGHWKLAAFAFGPLGVAVVVIANHFDRVKQAGTGAFNAVKGAVDALLRAINAVIGAVKSLIGWLGNIKVPKISLPHIPGTKTAGYGYGPQLALAGAGRSTAAGGVTVNFYGPTTDPEGTARAIARTLRAHELRQGRSSRAA
jgi:phage-related protein